MMFERDFICAKFGVTYIPKTREEADVLVALGVGPCSLCWFFKRDCSRVRCMSGTEDRWIYVKEEP